MVNTTIGPILVSAQKIMDRLIYINKKAGRTHIQASIQVCNSAHSNNILTCKMKKEESETTQKFVAQVENPACRQK